MIEFINSINYENLFLFVTASFMVALIARWHLSSDVSFDVKQAIVDDKGNFSLYKFGQLIALLASTWVVVNETKMGRMSEWLFIGYMVAWSGTNLANKYIDKALTTKVGEEK
jgi:hypothetical protein